MSADKSISTPDPSVSTVDKSISTPDPSISTVDKSISTTDDASVDFTDTSTHQSSKISMTVYSGPVADLKHEQLYFGSDDVNLSTTQAGVFLHSGSGNDALEVHSGNNVLDGGTGSNFMTGGIGSDTFYVDDRGAKSDIWSSIVGFHSGDNATIWGVTANDFHLNWLDNQGAVGAKGLTGGFTANGQPNANITLAGYSAADIGIKLSVTFGKTNDTPGLPGSVYMNIHAN
jgi:Ca2+-binding RTX toxin-like protein